MTVAMSRGLLVALVILWISPYSLSHSYYMRWNAKSQAFFVYPQQAGSPLGIRTTAGASCCYLVSFMNCNQSLLQLYYMLYRSKSQADFVLLTPTDKSITKFNKFSPDFLCILAQHKQAVKFCFLAASFIRSVLPILSSRPAFPAMRSLSYIMVTLLFVMRSAPVPAGIGGTWSPHSYTRESSGGSC